MARRASTAHFPRSGNISGLSMAETRNIWRISIYTDEYNDTRIVPRQQNSVKTGNGGDDRHREGGSHGYFDSSQRFTHPADGRLSRPDQAADRRQMGRGSLRQDLRDPQSGDRRAAGARGRRRRGG